MIIAFFHVLYLFGKYVYQKYYDGKEKGANIETQCVDKRYVISEADFKMIDPEAPQDYEESRTLRFSPPAYIQRYLAVKDVLTDTKYHAKLRKVVDFGCAELGFLRYLKNIEGIEEILCVDLDGTMLEVHKGKAEPLYSDYLHTRTTPLTIQVLEGSVIQNDKRLEGTDAVVCIELIEHLYPDTLMDFPYNVFGYVQPKVAVITTPNADFNVLFPNFSGFRHDDHKFEWTREQFKSWAENITVRYPDYKVTFHNICCGPKGTEDLGACTQMAVFNREGDRDGPCIPGIDGLFKEIITYEYPFRADNRSDEQKILDEAAYHIRQLSMKNFHMGEEVPLQDVFKMLKKFSVSLETLRTILGDSEWTVVDRDDGPVVLIPQPSFSDYSGGREDDFLSNDDDDEEWDDEAGPPIDYYYRQSLERRPNYEDQWNDDNWDEEPSIVIPEHHRFHKDHTYLYNGEQSSENWDDCPIETMDLEVTQDQFENIQPCSNTTGSISTGQELPSNSVSLALDQIDVDDLDTSLNSNIPSSFTRSVVLSSFPSSARSEEPEGSMSFNKAAYSHKIKECSETSIPMDEASLTEDFHMRMSVSCISTSPPPLSIHAAAVDNSYNDNSMLMYGNNSMSDSRIMNSTFFQSNTEKDIEQFMEGGSLVENMGSEAPSIDALADSCKHSRPLDKVSYVNEYTGMPCGGILKDENQLDGQCDMDNSMSVTNVDSSTSDDEPQFTSSPRVCAKTSYKERTSSSCIKKLLGRSSLSKVQFTKHDDAQSSHDGKCISGTNQNPHQSSSYISSESCTSSDNSSIRKWFDDEDNAMYRTGCVALKGGNATAGNPDNYNVLDCDVSVLEESLESEASSSNGKKGETSTDILDTDDLHNDLKFNTRQALQCLRNKETKSVLNIMNNDSKEFCPQEKGIVKVRETYNREPASLQCQEQLLAYSCAKEKRDAMSLRIDNDHLIQSALLLENEREAVSTSIPKRENQSKIHEMGESSECKPVSLEDIETPPDSYSPEIMDSGYPNSASAQDMTTPEYDLSSFAHDRISDSESPSVAEAPRLGFLEPVHVENGDLANNNRDGEGNNMIAAENNEIDDLQPFIDVLENDLENENDIYVVQNGFPVWLLRILEMANPVDLEGHVQQREPLAEVAGREFEDMDRDEGFDSTSSENDSDGENEMRNLMCDANQNDNIGDGNETDSSGDSVSDWVPEDT